MVITLRAKLNTLKNLNERHLVGMRTRSPSIIWACINRALVIFKILVAGLFMAKLN